MHLHLVLSELLLALFGLGVAIVLVCRGRTPDYLHKVPIGALTDM